MGFNRGLERFQGFPDLLNLTPEPRILLDRDKPNATIARTN